VRWCKKIGVVGLSLSLVAGFAADSSASTNKQTAVLHAIKDEVTIYNAYKTFSLRAAKLTAASTSAQSEAVAAPFGSAFKGLQGELRSQSWPSAAKPGVQQVYSALSPLIADMGLAGQMSSPTSASAWVSKTMSDLAVWVGALNVVNHDLGLPPFTANGSAVASCQADGATVAVALAAFRATNPSVKPSEAVLTGKGHGGPFLQRWPHSAHYSFTLNQSGTLLVAVPPDTKSVTYRGPSSCAAAGV
jgi:hypothetical protein